MEMQGAARTNWADPCCPADTGGVDAMWAGPICIRLSVVGGFVVTSICTSTPAGATLYMPSITCHGPPASDPFCSRANCFGPARP